MLFNNLAFLFLFLPLTIIAVHLASPRRYRMQVLIVASLIFYGLSGLMHAIVLVGCVIWVFLVVDRFSRANGDLRALWFAILGPLAALFYFKYWGFLVRDIFMLGTYADRQGFDLFQNIILPAGNSFFSFQLIAYAIDRYRGIIAKPVGFIYYFS